MKFIKTEYTKVIARAWGKGRNGSWYFMCTKVTKYEVLKSENNPQVQLTMEVKLVRPVLA